MAFGLKADGLKAGTEMGDRVLNIVRIKAKLKLTMRPMHVPSCSSAAALPLRHHKRHGVGKTNPITDLCQGSFPAAFEFCLGGPCHCYSEEELLITDVSQTSHLHYLASDSLGHCRWRDAERWW